VRYLAQKYASLCLELDAGAAMNRAEQRRPAAAATSDPVEEHNMWLSGILGTAGLAIADFPIDVDSEGDL
jgi:hypothetical protein